MGVRVICNPNYAAHVPPHEVDNGAVVPPWEVPGRFDAVRAALAAHGGFAFEDAPALSVDVLTGLHDAGYVAHLRDTSAALAGGGGWVMPSVFPFAPGEPRGEAARRGAYCFDTFTAITAGTWAAALGGAAATYRAAELVAAGETRVAYALTRPPGHHAERGRCGGYSFLNNAALAADLLLDLGPVAVLDIDVHHGNGTQHLFYDSPDVLTVSVHGDPAGLFPYFSGFADETGTGRGLGFNLNLPLPPGTGVDGYRPAVAAALERVGRHRPAAVVVAFGADAHEADPIGGMRLPTAYFAELGAAVRALGVPAVVTQEGGYDLATVGACAAAFLAALGDEVSRGAAVPP
ncbi:histone deacetylase family protein [Urbifossiella limnaea]|uniref:Acetylpolyamine aminohydrolase n=1 Tax=Urbifossiella limnaea TaxID=2528023 RepID=A0A517XKX3_9BACT|nr:histone deacetylase family protein [Urbifossiella limnaea]QDU18161.1 Acetylpolyamine aminohydrolase [Urbifossiella limnaea]